MDTTAIVIAAIVAIPTLLSTTILPLLLRRSERAERYQQRMEDLARLKETADKAEAVAVQAREAARLLAVNTAKSAEATQTLTNKVDVVHTLVNSSLTLMNQRLREALSNKLELMIKFEPEKSAIDIAALKLEIAELDAVLRERGQQADVVKAQQETQAKR